MIPPNDFPRHFKAHPWAELVVKRFDERFDSLIGWKANPPRSAERKAEPALASRVEEGSQRS